MVKNEDLEEIQRLAQGGKIGQVLIYVENLCDSVYSDGYSDGYSEGYDDGVYKGYMQGHEDGYNYDLTHDYGLEF